MKVLLVTPLAIYGSIRRLPLGVGYISSILKKNNHEVRLYDRFLKGYRLGDRAFVDREMKSEILGFKPDIIGFSTMSPVIYDTAECVEYIRNFYNGIIIAGGYHATAMPKIMLQKIPGLDYVAAGEAEYTMLLLANGADPSTIPGLFSKNSDDSNFLSVHIKNLDDLPVPDYDLFDMDYYAGANPTTFKGFYIKSSNILSSRGCNNNCKFCSESLSFGKGIRYHSVDYVIENIKKLVTDFKVEGIYFHDNDFLSSHLHAENICRAIIKNKLNKKIKWAIQARTKTVDSDILNLLSEAGCAKIEFGIESSNNSFLKSINKNATTEANERAVLLCKHYRIKVHTFFMTGFKGESISDLNEIIVWIKKYKPHTFSLSRMQLHPGTQLYKESGADYFEKHNWKRKNIEKFYNYDRFSSISQKDRIKWYFQTYQPFRSLYYRKTLLKTNSFPALLRMVYAKVRKLI